jgi:membrane-bound lytic murein transglycosylase MltF
LIYLKAIKTQKLVKRKYVYYSIVIAVVLLVAFWVYRQNTPRTYEQIQLSGVLRVGVNQSNVSAYSAKGDSVKGFQYDLVLALCDSLNLKPEFVFENSLQSSIKSLENGKIDIIARNIPITSSYKDRVLFTIPIISTKPVLIQRLDMFNNLKNPIRKQFDLARQFIYVPGNSPHILRINNLAKEIGDSIFVVEIPNVETEQLIEKLVKGEIDYVVCDEKVAKTQKQIHPEIDIEMAIGFTQMQAWALPKKSHTLQEKVNKFLEQFLQTEEYRNIFREYYP